jgi:hypothetical protein
MAVMGIAPPKESVSRESFWGIRVVPHTKTGNLKKGWHADEDGWKLIRCADTERHFDFKRMATDGIPEIVAGVFFFTGRDVPSMTDRLHRYCR